MERLLARLEGQGAPGLRVGFSRLDALTQGFQPGNLVVLAARPGIGKTALALNWLLRAAHHQRAFGTMLGLCAEVEGGPLRIGVVPSDQHQLRRAGV